MESIYLMNNRAIWNAVLALISEFRVSVRLKTSSGDDPSDWSPWLTFPSESYVEISSLGPVNKCDVLWIEIRTIESKKVGRLVPLMGIDHSVEIFERLLGEGIVWDNIDANTIRIILASSKE